MITRPHVCLRCQLRLARRTTTTISRIQPAFHSTSANRPNTPSQPSGEGGEQGEAQQRYMRHGFLHQSDIARHPLRTLYPMGKLHGNKQQQERERLDVEALGRPADVIVLRDPKFRTYSHVEIISPDEKPQSIDILAALDNERGLAGQQEVDENINQFRPKNGREPQDWDAFNTLVKDIQASFTISQLARYITSFTKAHGAEPSTPSDRLLIPRITQWMPVSSQTTKRSGDNHTPGYSLASYTYKQRMVLRLLRECWEVEVPELEASVGEVELELKPKDYDLLMRSSRSIVSLIAAEYINGEDERIDGFGSENTIRITTTRLKSEMIINEIGYALKNIRREDIYLADLMQPSRNKRQLRRWADTQFNSSTIKELSRLTNTDIEVLPKERLLVSCVDLNPGSAKGNKIDIAVRLLVSSANFSNRVTGWLGCRESSKSSSGVFIKYPAVEGLGWRDRLRQWTRWSAPIAKRDDNEGGPKETDAGLETPENDALSPTSMKNESPDTTMASQEMTENLEQNHDNQSGETSATHNNQPEETSAAQENQTEETSVMHNEPEISAHWQDSYRTESSALIGSVLHSYADDTKASTMALQPVHKSVKVHRTFATAVPNLSRLLGSRSTRGIRPKPLRTLIMHFQPNPFFKSRKTSKPIGAAALSAFPPVEMRFSIDPGANAFKVRDIQAIVSAKNSDLMLPESASDVRFQQRSTSNLSASPGQFPPGIAEFLRDSDLDIRDGNFDAPAKLSIPIARHLCQAPGLEILGGGEKGADTQDVEYLFTGLEIRKTVMMSYEGWRLHYTSIEAGRAGGRRGELRLLPVRVDESPSPATEEEFLEAACRLAGGVTRDGVEESPTRMVRAARPVTKVWVDPKPDPAEKIPRYFSKKVDIRQRLVHVRGNKIGGSGESIVRVEDIEYMFGGAGDEDQFA